MSVIEKYREFLEALEDANIKTKEELTKWLGYKPSEKQQVLILARSKRENWKHRYYKVMRDKRGRFISWKRVARSLTRLLVKPRRHR